MTVEFRSGLDLGVGAVADLLTAAYAGYFVPLHISAPTLLHMVRVDSVDLAATRVIVADGEPLGIGLIARRGWTSRLAALAILPAARRRGLGRRLLERLLAEGRERGDRRMVLEVIEANEAAIALYRRFGFTDRGRLLGGSGSVTPAASGNLRAVDLPEVAAALGRHGPKDLPWQIGPQTLGLLAAPIIGLAGDGAWLAVRDTGEGALALCALTAAPPDAERRAVALLRAAAARWPGRRWSAPPLWPEEAVAGIFEEVGLARSPITQRLMQLTLAEVPGPGAPGPLPARHGGVSGRA